MVRIDDDVERVLEFRELQRARYLMPTAQLAAELARERGFGERELFGASILIKPETEEELRRKRSARFPDELAALRAFVHATVVLDGANGQMTDLANKLSAGAAGRRRGPATIKVSHRAGNARRGFDESYTARLLDDFVDVGVRLHEFPPERLRLLVEYYLFGCTAHEIASELGCCAASVGGRLGQARRSLREALVDLLPSAKKKEPRAVEQKRDDLEERRAKVSRFLLKRAKETGGGEVAS